MDQLASRLLWLGHEDLTGLWEAEAEAELVLANKESSDPVRRAAVVQTLLTLAKQDLIHLYRGPEPLRAEASSRVSLLDIEGILDDKRSWEVPPRPGATGVRYATTDRGIEEYDRAEGGWPKA
jgi:hypothetical protein